MKKTFVVWSLILIFSLAGCSPLDTASVETLKGWSFQYNQGTDDFSLFFGLLDGDGQPVSAAVDVDIRIVNEAEEEVYAATKSVTKDDFGTYTSKVAEEEYLAEIRIPREEFSLGRSANGTVYLTVYKDNFLRFDEVNCSALYCLPVSDVEVVTEELPMEIPVKGYSGNVESKIRIEEVSYVYETKFTPTLQITVSGTKTFGDAKTANDLVTYKVYDSMGYVVESGELFISGIGEGDKFRDDSIYLYDITPGDTYKITFAAYEW